MGGFCERESHSSSSMEVGGGHVFLVEAILFVEFIKRLHGQVTQKNILSLKRTKSVLSDLPAHVSLGFCFSNWGGKGGSFIPAPIMAHVTAFQLYFPFGWIRVMNRSLSNNLMDFVISSNLC